MAENSIRPVYFISSHGRDIEKRVKVAPSAREADLYYYSPAGFAMESDLALAAMIIENIVDSEINNIPKAQAYRNIFKNGQYSSKGMLSGNAAQVDPSSGIFKLKKMKKNMFFEENNDVLFQYSCQYPIPDASIWLATENAYDMSVIDFLILKFMLMKLNYNDKIEKRKNLNFYFISPVLFRYVLFQKYDPKKKTYLGARRGSIDSALESSNILGLLENIKNIKTTDLYHDENPQKNMVNNNEYFERDKFLFYGIISHMIEKHILILKNTHFLSRLIFDSVSISKIISILGNGEYHYLSCRSNLSTVLKLQSKIFSLK